MKIIKYIILFIYVIVCIALIVLATIQRSEKAGASGTIMGSSSVNFYEQNKARTKKGKLKRWTVGFGVTFTILAIILSILILIK